MQHDILVKAFRNVIHLSKMRHSLVEKSFYGCSFSVLHKE